MFNSAIQIQPGVDGERGAPAFRNRVINGQFDIWQRGTTFSDTVVGYHADRWRIGASDFGGGTLAWTVDRIAFTFGQTEVSDNPTYYLNFASAITGGPGTERTLLSQRIEDVKTLSGKKATLSFWAKGSIPGGIVVNFRQNTATPSSPFFGNIAVTLSTSWQKFVFVVDVPVLSGSFAAGNSLNLHFMTQAGASNPAGVPGFQYTGTVSLANVQLEEGALASTYEKKFLGTELALCQRYYEEGFKEESNFATPSLTNEMWFDFQVDKRIVPTISIFVLESPPTSSNLAPGSFVGVVRTDGFRLTYASNALADCAIISALPLSAGRGPWTADAEL